MVMVSREWMVWSARRNPIKAITDSSDRWHAGRAFPPFHDAGAKWSRSRGAVDRQGRARDERGFVRQQKQRSVGDLIGLAGTAHRDLLAAPNDEDFLVFVARLLL